MKPRIDADADVSPQIIELLRREGYDATSCLDAGTGDEADEWHLRRAASEGRVILTYNLRDFRRLAKEFVETNMPRAGILASYRQYQADELGVLRRVLLAFLAERSAEDMANVMLILPQPRVA